MDDLEWAVTHQPCPDCGSSDALSINTNGATKCFACEKFTPSKNNITHQAPQKMQTNNNFVRGEIMDTPTRS